MSSDSNGVVRTAAISARGAEPTPADQNKHAWQRRFTWLVSLAMAARPDGRTLSPSEAGAQASAQVRSEWTRTFPGVNQPDWMAALDKR